MKAIDLIKLMDKGYAGGYDASIMAAWVPDKDGVRPPKAQDDMLAYFLTRWVAAASAKGYFKDRSDIGIYSELLEELAMADEDLRQLHAFIQTVMIREAGIQFAERLKERKMRSRKVTPEVVDAFLDTFADFDPVLCGEDVQRYLRNLFRDEAGEVLSEPTEAQCEQVLARLLAEKAALLEDKKEAVVTEAPVAPPTDVPELKK